MKKLLLLFPLLAAAAFVVLGLTNHPAPTVEVATTLPASKVLEQ